MKALRTTLLGVIGLFVFCSCGLFGPSKPYNQGDRHDPIQLDQPHPEKEPPKKLSACRPIDYLLPWRLRHCKR